MYYLHYPVGPVQGHTVKKPQVLVKDGDKSVEVRVLFGLSDELNDLRLASFRNSGHGELSPAVYIWP